jgi:hypothetical protein
MKNKLVVLIIAITVLISMACVCNPLGYVSSVNLNPEEKQSWKPVKMSAEIRVDGISTNHGRYLGWGEGVLVYQCTAELARITPVVFKNGALWAEWIPRYGLEKDICAENAP